MVQEPQRSRVASIFVLVVPVMIGASACRPLAPEPVHDPRRADPRGADLRRVHPRSVDLGAAVAPVKPEDDATPPATPPPSPQALRREANRVIDDWHAAAAVGDAARYLGHLAPDAVFMGTDATERWDFAAFSAYVQEHMTTGHGWAYVPSQRGLVIPEDSQWAWFDEQLSNERNGELRGTGVLRRDGESWRIVHYSMTFTVPNGVARDVVALIRGH